MYSFNNLRNIIENDLGIDTSNGRSKFKPIREVFKTSADLEQNIDLGPGVFIYTDKIGKKHKGFLFIEGGYDYETAKLRGWKTVVPKFHILNCSTIDQQKNKQNFNGHYVFSQKVELVKDLDGIEKEITLCKNCLNLQSEIRNVLKVSDYVKNYVNSDTTDGNFNDDDLPSSRRNIFQNTGYTPDWDKTSHDYRLSVKFTCQNCGIGLNSCYSDGYYLETHHIDGNKQNNSDNNLKALCTLCHANENEIHKRNYSIGRNKQKLESFIFAYKNNLEEVENPYLTNYM